MCYALLISLRDSMKNIAVYPKFTNVNLKKIIERPGGSTNPIDQFFLNPDPTFERL